MFEFEKVNSEKKELEKQKDRKDYVIREIRGRKGRGTLVAFLRSATETTQSERKPEKQGLKVQKQANKEEVSGVRKM